MKMDRRLLVCIICKKEVVVKNYGKINKKRKILKVLATDETYTCANCRKNQKETK